MAILTPVNFKETLVPNVPVEVYHCPEDKSHAILDATFYRDTITQGTLIRIGTSKKTSASQLTSLDYFFDDIELANDTRFAELNKIILGPGERLFVEVLEGENVNFRMTGVEEANPRVLKAGRLGAVVGAANTSTDVFELDAPGAAYATFSLTIFNSDVNDASMVEMWITDKVTPEAVDKIFGEEITTEDTALIEAITLHPGERVVIRSSTNAAEYFANGLIIGSV